MKNGAAMLHRKCSKGQLSQVPAFPKEASAAFLKKLSIKLMKPLTLLLPGSPLQRESGTFKDVAHFPFLLPGLHNAAHLFIARMIASPMRPQVSLQVDCWCGNREHTVLNWHHQCVYAASIPVSPHLCQKSIKCRCIVGSLLGHFGHLS